MNALAQTVSAVLHPLCMPLLTLGLLLSTDGFLAHRLGLFAYLFVILLINTLAPVFSLWILRRRGVISDLDIRSRSERPLPFLIVLAYFVMAYVLVLNSHAVAVPVFYQNVLLALVVAISFAWIITWKAKISMHMMAQGGIMAVHLHVSLADQLWDMRWLSVLILCAGLVGWSRLHLGAHTACEVYTGFAVGLVTVFLTLF